MDQSIDRYPRKYVQPETHLDDFPQIEPYFDELLQRPLNSADDLRQWLRDSSELAACIGEVRTDRYVQMTCHTDDTALSERYMQFVEEVEPHCRLRWHALNEKYIATPAAAELDPDRYFVQDRSTRAAVELFREENVPLLVDQARYAQEYQQICGRMTVQFEGQEKTMQQMGVYLENTDREIRQAAWVAAAARRHEDHEKLDNIFDALLALRGKLARNADLDNYRTYAFRAYQRFDYTPEDCLRFHDAVAEVVVPAARRLHDRRRQDLGIETLRPWDLSVDPQGHPPLRPFETSDQLCSMCAGIFNAVDPALGRQFAHMQENGYLDLESRKGKAPGGYQSTYEEQRHPFIFMNAVGLQRDVETLLHEGGHAFHTYAARDEDLIEYRSSPIEFAEVASMSMELLALDHYDPYYAGDDLKRAKRKQLEGTIKLLPWVATIDAFQHWLYTHEGHTPEQRRTAWLGLTERFGMGVDYSGYEDVEASRWQQQLHLYQVPFYYIEYGIAQLGALQLWRNAKADRATAVRRYREALALGGSRPLPELFAAAGAAFEFTAATIAPLVQAVEEELAALEG